jgi:hypothetical protein
MPIQENNILYQNFDNIDKNVKPTISVLEQIKIFLKKNDLKK